MKKNPRVVSKPWGSELIWAESPSYIGKILRVKAGEALSLQYHEVKDETIHLLAGEMRFWAGRSAEDLVEIPMTVGDSFHVVPRTVHRMEAISDCEILEASTAHLHDVVRLEDRYGRLNDPAVSS
ncbi:MAG: cupin domain-containing protein [Gemmatimonadetes bacterium]|nr:cupin domain-containing protein [Gemmatimonadota bacterium]